MRIGIFAFATSAVFFKEVVSLAKKRGEDIEWSVIIPRSPFKDFFDDVLPAERVLYIYRDFNRYFADSDSSPYRHLMFSESNVNTILATDKDGYRHEDKDFQYRWASAMLAVYRDFLTRVSPQYMIFSGVETVEQSLLVNLCQDMGIGVVKNVHMRTLGYSFFSTSQYDSLPPYFGSFSDDDRAKALSLLEKYETGDRDPVGFPPLREPGHSMTYTPAPILSRFLRGLLDRLRQERWRRSEDGVIQRIKVNVQCRLYALRRLRYRLFYRNLFEITPERNRLPERFILYAAQVTPEASINGLAQYFVDQERAIDLLRLNLPHGYVLVVKEHPGMMGVRPSSYYRRQRKMPGVVMASPEIPMETLSARAALIATVTGTVGLESYLSGWPCIMFGRNFFSHLCAYPNVIEGLREKIEEIIDNFRPATRTEKIGELARLYGVCYPFVLYEAPFLGQSLERENIANFLDAVRDHIRRVEALLTAAS